MKPEDIVARLTPFLERETGGPVQVANVRTLTGGATREAWSLDVTIRENGAPRELGLVLLIFRPGGQRAFTAGDEFRLLAATRAAGAPVPKPMFVGEAELGRPFYMMERLSGETIGRRLVREERFAEARRVLPQQLAEALAAIHRVPLDGGEPLDFLPRPEPGKPVVASELERLEEMYRQITVEPHPAFEIAFRWLADRQPTSTDVALVHGDFRVGNVMVGEEGLRAVLDWELAHAGDPFEDLGWLCVRSWRFGVDHLPMGGVSVQGPMILHKSAVHMPSGNTPPIATYALADGAYTPTTSARGKDLFLRNGQLAAAGFPLYWRPQDDHFLSTMELESPHGVLKVGIPANDPTAPNQLVLLGDDQKPRWSNPKLFQEVAAVAFTKNAILLTGLNRLGRDKTEIAASLVALRPTDGQVIWQMPLPAVPTAWGLALDSNGRIAVTLMDGRTMAFRQP